MTCKSMTVYNTVLGDGAVNDALVLEYSVPLLPDSIYPGAYEVFGRQILRAYVSERPEPGAPGRGPYVVLELDPVDILERIRGRDEHICIHEQSLAVRQREAVQAENGERLTAMKTFRIAVKNRTPQVEGFQQFQKDGALLY